MNLIGQIVSHKALGEGKIIEHSEGCLMVGFAKGNKSFAFPDSFELFLKAKNAQIEEHIRELLKNQIQAKEQNAAAQLIELERRSLIRAIEEKLSEAKPSQGYRKPYSRPNIAFKCNYCDGGQSAEQIGFDGACSDAVIINNIVVERRTWCSSEECPCLEYHNGEISREELDEMCTDGGSVCYESQLLRDWKASAGVFRQGDNSGKPKRLTQMQLNSLCILTTRDPKSSEKDRYIFAVFLVDDNYEGDVFEAGFVCAHSKFRIKLTPNEAREMKFWNYHANDNQPEQPAWNSGLYRYLENEKAAQILKDVMKLKMGTEDEVLTIELIKHFCRINRIDADTLSEPFGALRRK